MNTVILLPPIPKNAPPEVVQEAKDAALKTYLRIMRKRVKRGPPCLPDDAPMLVSTAHMEKEGGYNTNTLAVAMRNAGYVKLGQCRNGPTAYTCMYAHESVAAQYASPTAAFKEFLQCVKS